MSGASRSTDDQRTEFQIDRDRVLYSLAFRRLAGVTQVVSPGEGEIFHNRLTHSLKVAQIARRFAETLSTGFPSIVHQWGGLDPDVVEAAALAHDLGHPPFGHIAEEELGLLVRKAQGVESTDDFEGNAQSFRIVTELAVRRSGSADGLDLTRAVLNATLKYPWRRGENQKQPKKYGAYYVDNRAYTHAREGMRCPVEEARYVRSLEAQIMDWSDDIAYSVHDTEDFYRAGLIPLDRLVSNTTERGRFLDKVLKKAEEAGKPIKSYRKFQQVFSQLFESINIDEPYAGSREQQELLYEFVSSTIHRFVTNTSLSDEPDEDGNVVSYPPEIAQEVMLLKQLIWIYVIENPSFSAHQTGQRRIIRRLFRDYNLAAVGERWEVFPPFYSQRAIDLCESTKASGGLAVPVRVRLVADTIASLTDKQAMLIYQQFTGHAPGSMLDPVVG